MKTIRCLILFLSLGLIARAQAASDSGPQLGLQSWTCRNMTFEGVVDFAVKHHLKQIEFTPKHLNPDAPREENLRKKALLEKNGLVAYSFGVNHCSLDPVENRKLFELARLMGMKVIAVEPADPAVWDQLEKLVKEYDIKLAIHNHNLSSPYGDPAKVLAVLAARDHRIGVCLDIGWITAAGFDAATVFRNYGDRVYDMHLKDKILVKSAGGALVPTDTEPGRGSTNYPALFAEIRKAHWSGIMAIETDGKVFSADPGHLVDVATVFFKAQTESGQP